MVNHSLSFDAALQAVFSWNDADKNAQRCLPALTAHLKDDQCDYQPVNECSVARKLESSAALALAGCRGAGRTETQHPPPPRARARHI